MAPMYIWRSYKALVDNHPGARLPFGLHSIPDAAVWEVAYIATAPSKRLPDIEIGGTKFRIGDDIRGKTALYVLQEFGALHASLPALFISIETEPQVKYEEINLGAQEISRPLNPRSDSSTSPKTQVDAKELPGWIKRCNAIGLKEHYRLSVQDLLNRILFDEWQTRSTRDDPWQTMKRTTDEHLARYEVRQHIKSIAEIAVSVRRARARTERWEKFALDVVYFCPLCQDGQCHPERDSLRNHLLMKCQDTKRSKMSSDSIAGEIDILLDKGRAYL